MSSCEQQHLLEAYHDGELTAADAARFEEHLRSCGECAAELARLQATSEPLRRLRAERLTPQQWAAMHRAIDRAEVAPDDSQTLRLAATLSVLAASVMLIGLAWLRVLTPTASRSTAPGNAVVSTHPLHGDERAWERVAMTLQPDPLSLPPPTEDQTAAALGQPDLADWMLQGLSHRSHAGQRTEQR